MAAKPTGVFAESPHGLGAGVLLRPFFLGVVGGGLAKPMSSPEFQVSWNTEFGGGQDRS